MRLKTFDTFHIIVTAMAVGLLIPKDFLGDGVLNAIGTGVLRCALVMCWLTLVSITETKEKVNSENFDSITKQSFCIYWCLCVLMFGPGDILANTILNGGVENIGISFLVLTAFILGTGIAFLNVFNVLFLRIHKENPSRVLGLEREDRHFRFLAIHVVSCFSFGLTVLASLTYREPITALYLICPAIVMILASAYMLDKSFNRKGVAHVAVSSQPTQARKLTILVPVLVLTALLVSSYVSDVRWPGNTIAAIVVGILAFLATSPSKAMKASS